MTAPTWPQVHICACGRLEQEHDLRPATKTLPERRVGTNNGACSGFELAGVEERPPASVLRARLEAVLALHEDDGTGHCTTCIELLPAYWPCPTVRAARGETA